MYICMYLIKCFTLYPDDLKWHPLLVSVDFILMQKARSKVGLPDCRSNFACISDVTGKQTKMREKMNKNYLALINKFLIFPITIFMK